MKFLLCLWHLANMHSQQCLYTHTLRNWKNIKDLKVLQYWIKIDIGATRLNEQPDLGTCWKYIHSIEIHINLKIFVLKWFNKLKLPKFIVWPIFRFSILSPDLLNIDKPMPRIKYQTITIWRHLWTYEKYKEVFSLL